MNGAPETTQLPRLRAISNQPMLVNVCPVTERPDETKKKNQVYAEKKHIPANLTLARINQ